MKCLYILIFNIRNNISVGISINRALISIVIISSDDEMNTK